MKKVMPILSMLSICLATSGALAKDSPDLYRAAKRSIEKSVPGFGLNREKALANLQTALDQMDDATFKAHESDLLVRAAQLGDPEGIQAVFSKDPNLDPNLPDSKGQIALLEGAMRAHVEAILIHPGFDYGTRYLDAFKLLIEHQANVNSYTCGKLFGAFSKMYGVTAYDKLWALDVELPLPGEAGPDETIQTPDTQSIHLLSEYLKRKGGMHWNKASMPCGKKQNQDFAGPVQVDITMSQSE